MSKNTSAKRILSAVLALSMLAGCSPAAGSSAPSQPEPQQPASSGTDAPAASETGSSGEPSWKKDTSEFTIDWYIDLSWWAWNGLPGKDLTSQIMKEKTGATINFIVPATDGGEQLSTMIASNSLPDVLTLEGWWSQKARMLNYQLSQEQYILPYNDLIDQYAPDMWNNIRKDVFNWFQEKDGKTYVLPNYAYSSQDLAPGERLVPNGCITIRDDLYQKIGSPDMSTKEGFFAACEKIKNEQFDGQNIIPIQLYENVGNSINWMAQMYVTPFEDEKGNWIPDFPQSSYKEALSFFNEAYRKGYIGEANFSDNRDMINEKIASGRVFTMVTAPQDFIPAMQTLYDRDPKAVYTAMLTRNSKGEDPVLQDIRGFGWLGTSITANAKQPERVLQLMNYLTSDEGQVDMVFGKEGETYEWVENRTKIKQTDTYLEAVRNNDQKKYGLDAMTLLDNFAFWRKFKLDSTEDKLLKTDDQLIKAPLTQYSYDFNAASLLPDPTDPRQTEVQQINTKIQIYRSQVIPEIVTAPSAEEFEARYQAALDELYNLGYQKVIDYNNDAFQNAKKALNVERAWPLFQK